MKRILPILFLLLFVFCAPADPPCVTTPCPENINKIADCPDEGCTRTEGHKFDQELDKRKNIRSDDQQAVLRSIRWMKGLDDPTNLTECGSRDELKQLGEGQKITVVAWALTAKPGSGESCNCDLPHQVDLDNHIVLVDPRVKNPTLAKEIARVFVRLDQGAGFIEHADDCMMRARVESRVVKCVSGLDIPERIKRQPVAD